MVLRRDHIAAAAFIALGLAALALSRDLPVGTLASPGPGMLPMIAIVLMMGFAAALLFQARASPPLASIGVDGVPHALRVAIVAGAGVAGYTTLGFLTTIALLLFILLAAVERVGIVKAAAFSIGVTLATWLLFAKALKAPLPTGPFGF